MMQQSYENLPKKKQKNIPKTLPHFTFFSVNRFLLRNFMSFKF